MKKTKLYLNYAGHCYAKEYHAIQGGRKKEIKFHALWGIIEHPEKGLILFDTGYTNRFYAATKLYPNKIYALATRVEIKDEDTIVSQITRGGIDPYQIRHIIISHFHADHICGLKDFPNACIYSSRDAYKQVRKIPRMLGFTQGILKDLIPADLSDRIFIIEDHCGQIKDEVLGVKYDLFGDASVYSVPLPGHAAGQFGILLSTEKAKYFLIADACWLKQSFEEYILPHPIVKLFFHSWADFKTSLRMVHQFHISNPDVIIVPTHCTETTSRLIRPEIDLNVL